jgi:hypothetical protein
MESEHNHYPFLNAANARELSERMNEVSVGELSWERSARTTESSEGREREWASSQTAVKNRNLRALSYTLPWATFAVERSESPERK